MKLALRLLEMPLPGVKRTVWGGCFPPLFPSGQAAQHSRTVPRPGPCPGTSALPAALPHPGDAGATERTEPHLPARSGCGGPGAVRRCHLAPGWASAPFPIHRARRTSTARSIGTLTTFSVGSRRCRRLPISRTVGKWQNSSVRKSLSNRMGIATGSKGSFPHLVIRCLWTRAHIQTPKTCKRIPKRDSFLEDTFKCSLNVDINTFQKWILGGWKHHHTLQHMYQFWKGNAQEMQRENLFAWKWKKKKKERCKG